MNATAIPERDPLAPLNQAEQSDIVNDIIYVLGSEAVTKIEQVSWDGEDNGIRVQTETFDYKGNLTHLNGQDKKRSTLVFSLLNGANTDSQLVINVGDVTKPSAVLFRGKEPVELDDEVATYLCTYARRLVLGMVYPGAKFEPQNALSLARDVIVNTLGAGSKGYLSALKSDLKSHSHLDTWSVRVRDLPEKLFSRAVNLKESTVTKSRIFYLTEDDGQRTEVREDGVMHRDNHGSALTSYERYVKISRYFRAAATRLPTVIERSGKLTIRGNNDMRAKAERSTHLIFGVEGVEDLPESPGAENNSDFLRRVAQHGDLLEFEAATMKLAYVVKSQQNR